MRLPPASVDLCLTSVPYFGSRWSGRAAPDCQLYAANHYAEYLDGLDQVFRQVREALTEGGHVVAMAENVRLPGGMFLPLAWDVARVLGRCLTLCEERVILYRRSLPDDPDPRRTNRAHEYALVARRHAAGVDLAEAASLLTALALRDVPFVVVGSLARQWLAAADPARPAHDVDILVPSAIDSLNRLVQSLIEHGFAVHCWDEPVRPPVEPNRLQGRCYLRGPGNQDREQAGSRRDIRECVSALRRGMATADIPRRHPCREPGRPGPIPMAETLYRVPVIRFVRSCAALRGSIVVFRGRRANSACV